MLVSLNNSAIELGVVGNFESEKYSSAVARVSIAASLAELFKLTNMTSTPNVVVFSSTFSMLLYVLATTK
jgi:hypothetical protein